MNAVRDTIHRIRCIATPRLDGAAAPPRVAAPPCIDGARPRTPASVLGHAAFGAATWWLAALSAEALAGIRLPLLAVDPLFLATLPFASIGSALATRRLAPVRAVHALVLVVATGALHTLLLVAWASVAALLVR